MTSISYSIFLESFDYVAIAANQKSLQEDSNASISYWICISRKINILVEKVCHNYMYSIGLYFHFFVLQMTRVVCFHNVLSILHSIITSNERYILKAIKVIIQVLEVSRNDLHVCNEEVSTWELLLNKMNMYNILATMIVVHVHVIPSFIIPIYINLTLTNICLHCVITWALCTKL